MVTESVKQLQSMITSEKSRIQRMERFNGGTEKDIGKYQSQRREACLKICIVAKHSFDIYNPTTTKLSQLSKKECK